MLAAVLGFGVYSSAQGLGTRQGALRNLEFRDTVLHRRAFSDLVRLNLLSEAVCLWVHCWRVCEFALKAQARRFWGLSVDECTPVHLATSIPCTLHTA